MVALGGGESLAARHHLAPVALKDLHRAIGPAKSLSLIRREAVRHKALTEAVRHINRFIARFEQAEAEFGVFGDAPLTPATDFDQSRLADQGHSAVLDDRVAFVPLDHADFEEALVFPVAHGLEGVATPVAIVLRRLDETNLLALEVGDGR